MRFPLVHESALGLEESIEFVRWCLAQASPSEDRDDIEVELTESTTELAEICNAIRHQRYPDDGQDVARLACRLSSWMVTLKIAYELHGIPYDDTDMLERYEQFVAIIGDAIWEFRAEAESRSATVYHDWQDGLPAPTITPTPSGQRAPLTPEIRAAVWEKTDGHCWYCGRLTNPFSNFEIDHFQPLADGGTNDLSNLVPACTTCNRSKHAQSLEVFRRRQRVIRFWFEREGRSS